MSDAPYDEVSLVLSDEDEMEIDWFDHTKLSAICTCPVWGIVRYGYNKVMNDSSRAMALEVGSAAHDVFAALRLLDYYENQGENESNFLHHGIRLFGDDRFEEAQAAYDVVRDEDLRTRQLAFCLTILESTGFVDDPRDKRRTMANLQEACIAYIDQWRWGKLPIWTRESHTEFTEIGIEIPFSLTMKFFKNKEVQRCIRYTGRLDGLHSESGGDKVRLGENKTGARLDDAWSQSFIMSHQVTGYMIAAQIITGTPCNNGDVLGMQVPLPRSWTNGIVREYVTRDNDAYDSWARWIWYTTETYYQFYDNVVNAPQYTHSCNRYFRPCSMIPFCGSPNDEKQEILDSMPIKKWDPLDDE